MFIVFNVFYLIIAIAMIVLILMQNGSGATAGSGFGAGASATVFGARGSTNFMSRATAVAATLFFLLSLGMGVYLRISAEAGQSAHSNLGVMSGVTHKPIKTTKLPVRHSDNSATQHSTNTDVPIVPASKHAKGKH